ncbi:MAG: 16S rRNA (guanine(966)-N(2))-methyltransferase RsmD [Gammaproteobacteria bacterium]|nr:MAG: 16S rRNA (guanine(966)-N(2))-methyltransferase RsmD [Gammaproteobacteria bacterium]
MSRHGQIRIIAGKWRGRRLPVPNEPGLRPTTDRVRETLFNWLSDDIADRACLDLFAGSGALGFEAASRGAATVTMIERARRVVGHLRKWVDILGADNIRIVHADALQWLAKMSDTNFDLVFIDPPFQANLHAKALNKLMLSGMLKPGALVYVETEQRAEAPFWDNRFSLVKEKAMGGITARLLRFVAHA